MIYESLNHLPPSYPKKIAIFNIKIRRWFLKWNFATALNPFERNTKLITKDLKKKSKIPKMLKR